MIGRSLRWRLLAGAGIAIFVALFVAWIFMMFLFERHLERRLADELRQDGIRIVAGLTVPAGGGLAIEEPPADGRFQTPASGLYWQVSHGGSAVRSPSLWDQALPPPATVRADDWRMRVAPGPFEPRLVLLEREVLPTAGAAPVLVQIGQDAAVLEVANEAFGRELAIFLALLWLVLSAAAWVQVELGLRPLARIRAQLARLQGSPSERLAAAGLSEVRPLIGAINELADAREHDLERARRRATDLAHGLKTPLSALAAQARRARAEGADGPADGLDKAIDAMRSVVDAELARTRIASVRRAVDRPGAVRKVAEKLVSVLERTEAGEALAFTIAIDGGLLAPVAEEDLTELLGAIADNAARFARRQICFDGSDDGGGVLVTVEDDGPGIDDGAIETALMRGERLDESGGHGLGLAIARELMEATGGSVTLSRSALGGLRVELRWPNPPA